MLKQTHPKNQFADTDFLIIQKRGEPMNKKEISDILRDRRMLLDDFVVIRKQKYFGLYRIERDPIEELYIIGEPVRYDNDFPHGELLFYIDGMEVYAYPHEIEPIQTYCGLKGTRSELRGHSCSVCIEGDRKRRAAFEIERMQRLGKL